MQTFTLTPLAQVALSLAGAAVLLIVLGVRMTRLADRIATATGMSRGFAGMLLLAVATSLPELVSSTAATLVMGAPGLTFGNVYGSNVANLGFLALMDVFVVGSIFVCATRHDARNAGIGVMLTALSVGAIELSRRGVDVAHWMRALSVTIIGVYLLALRVSYEPKERAVAGAAESAGERPPWLSFLACAAGVVLVSLWLTRSCADLAALSGLGQTFVGSLVLALATSLPELVVSLEAVRLGSPAMAIGNLVGSNLFNLTILAGCALAAPQSNLYAVREATASLPVALSGIAMMLVVATACWTRSSVALLGRLSPISLLLGAAYVVSNVLAYGR